MKSIAKRLPLALFLLTSCITKTKSPAKELVNDEFKWSITIPEGFDSVSPEEWTKMQNKGADAIEQTYDQEIINNAKTIFVFRSDPYNYFESRYQPFDPAVDGDYMETFRTVNGMLYGTFEAQMPDATLDSVSSMETIDGKEFHLFKTTITIPEKLSLELNMYSRLFGKKEFTVNIITADKNKQKELLEAWRHSKFGLN